MKKKRSRMSLSSQVLVGFVLGVATGIFFGELASSLNVFGQAFIGLLQMTVLPYVVVSLILGLGRLSAKEAGRLALNGGLVLALISVIGLLLVAAFPLAFPAWESATFFSTTLVEEQKPFDLLGLYIPTNPFHSLANSIVPAVVLFCIAFGVALMSVKDKERILDDLTTLADALMRVAQFVARLAPYGVFAIVASAAGTYDVSDLNRIQVYLLTHAAISVLATFLILPGLVVSLTSIGYRDLVRSVWAALITAFATGNLLIVLPMLADESKRLLTGIQVEGKEAETAVDVLVPASFNFPSLGKLLSLAFVLFGGWFIGSTVSVARYFEFLITGFFTFFGSSVAAIPFLLGRLQLPTDLLELFVTIDVIASRFGTMLGAMSVLVLALLGGCAMGGALVFRFGRLLRFAVLSAAAVLVTLIGIRVFFTYVVHQNYEGYRNFVEMDLSTEPAPVEVYETPPAGDPDPTLPTLERIRQRGALRVGYSSDSLPFAFVNASNRVVGLDIELAHILAKQLGVSLELVPIDVSPAPQYLREGICDIVVGGQPMRPELFQYVSFSTPYMDETIAFVVRDHRRDDFSSRDAVQNLKKPRIGAMDVPYYVDLVRDYIPQAEIVLLSSPREFFRDESDNLDALLLTAEAGSAWSLVYPSFSVVVPQPDIVAVPLVYLVKEGDRGMVEYLNMFIELKKKDGTIQKLYEHWMLGKQAGRKGPRWSVIRDVLHWVD